MYDGIRVKNSIACLYTTVFCLRRLLIVLALMFLTGRNPYVLIYTFLIIMSLNYLYLVEANAHTNVFMNRLELLSELSLIGVLYTALFFIKTNQLDAQVVWNSGLGTISVLAFSFMINFGFMMVSNLKKSYKQGKI